MRVVNGKSRRHFLCLDHNMGMVGFPNLHGKPASHHQMLPGQPGIVRSCENSAAELYLARDHLFRFIKRFIINGDLDGIIQNNDPTR